MSMQGQVQEAGLKAAAVAHGKEVPQDSPAVDKVHCGGLRRQHSSDLARTPHTPARQVLEEGG